MQIQRGKVFPVVTTFWAFMFRHCLITGVYVSTEDFTCSGMQQQLSFSKDASEENAGWEKSIPTDNLSVTECSAAAGMWHPSSPELLLVHDLICNRWDPSSAESVAEGMFLLLQELWDCCACRA